MLDSTLPAVAKLNALRGEAADHRETSASAHKRLSELTRSNFSGMSVGQRKSTEAEIARLTLRRDTANAKHNELATLLAAVDHYLATLPPGTEVKLAKPLAARLKPGETFADALARVRAEITDMTRQLSAVKAAPLPAADLKKAAREYIGRMAAKGAPSVSGARGSFQVSWARADSWDAPTTMDRVIAIQAWLDPERMTAQLERQIDAMPVAEALSPSDKAKRLDQLTSDLDRLNRVEESLIEMAAADGLSVLRRPQASPAAVLGIVVRAA